MMGEQFIPMKSWADDDRPREKLLRKGASSLSTNELFAILLRSGVGGESALDLARRMLADNGNDLNQLALRSVRELMNKYKGVGIAKAASVVAAMEIGRRRRPETGGAAAVVCCSRDAYFYLSPIMSDLNHEEFWVIYLTHANRIIGSECLSSGGVDYSLIDARLLFRGALDHKACRLIVAHNHLGGTLEPSREDLQATRKLYEGGKLLDIQLYDHLIVGRDNYLSFADQDLLGG